MKALRLLAQSYTRVFREGELQQIPVADIVPGDIIYVEAGDMIPADGRLIETFNIWV